MPDAYENYEGRFITEGFAISSAGGLNAAIGPVPNGKVWTVLTAFITTSVAETQDFWFEVLSRHQGRPYPVTLPQEFILAPAVNENFPMLREGMELKVFQGEMLSGRRDAATAGSTISIFARYIESDLPLYEQVEVQARRTEIKRGEMRDRISTGRSGAFATGREGGGPARPGRTKEPA